MWLWRCRAIKKDEAIQMGFEKYFTLEVGDVVSIEINPSDEIGTKISS